MIALYASLLGIRRLVTVSSCQRSSPRLVSALLEAGIPKELLLVEDSGEGMFVNVGEKADEEGESQHAEIIFA
jgi:hypothetical protein